MQTTIMSLSILTVVATLATLCTAACPASKTTVSGRFAPSGQICVGQLLLDESFDSIRSGLWQHDVRMRGANGEFSWYTDSSRNTFIKNGVLNLKATLTTDVIPDLTKCNIQVANCTGSGADCSLTCSANIPAPPVQSALLNSRGGFNFKYGRVEISAQLPTGDWLWPALWFMPDTSAYGGWPRSGEIDLMESRGNVNLKQNGVNTGVEQLGSTLHFGTENWNSAWQTAHFDANTAAGQGLNRAFHLYGLEWTPDHLKFSLDGKEIGTVNTKDGYFKRGGFTGNNPWTKGGLDAPFDREFYFILNVAAGGTNGFFADNVGGKPWQNGAAYPLRDFWNGRQQWQSTWNTDSNAQLNTALRVDSIKVYAI